MPRWTSVLPLAVVLVAGAASCTPLLDVEGSFFPGWLISLVVGGILTAIAYRLLVTAGLDAYLTPPLLVYPSLALLCTMLAWLVLYRS